MGDIVRIQSQFGGDSELSLGIITDLSDSISHFSSATRSSNPLAGTYVKPFSQSLQNISSSTESIATSDSGFSKSICGNLHRIRKNKYDHVQSKVKLYRMEIQKQQREKKQRLSQDFREESASTKRDLADDFDSDTLLDELKDLKEKIEKYNKQITEKDMAMELLTKQVLDLMKENSDTRIRMDYLRLESQRYKDMFESIQQHKSDTPISVRSTRNSQLSILKTPIRSLSRTLLSPFRNSKPKTPAEEESASSDSESENEAAENGNHCGTFIAEPKSLQVYELRSSSSSTSDVPLIQRPESTNFARKAKSVFLELVACYKTREASEENTAETEGMIMRKIRRRSNKVHPLDEMAHAVHSAPSTMERTVTIFRDKGNLKIPTVTINTPTSDNTYVLHDNTRLSKKRVSYSTGSIEVTSSGLQDDSRKSDLFPFSLNLL